MWHVVLIDVSTYATMAAVPCLGRLVSHFLSQISSLSVCLSIAY